MALHCPESGARVFENPDWVGQKVSDTFTANFWLLNDSIIYSLPEGRGCIQSVRDSLRLNDDVVAYVSKSGRSHIQIEDYDRITGSTSEARRYFTDRMDNCEQLSALIFCNLSPALSIAVNIGKRLNKSGKRIYVVKHYRDAVKLALELDNHKIEESEHPPIDLTGCFPNTQKSLSPIDVAYSDDWSIQTLGYSNTLVIVDHSILHSTVEGYLEATHLGLIDRFRERCLADLGGQSPIDYVVINCENFAGGTRAARIGYMKSLVSWHSRHPFRTFIGYNTNTFMKTALRLAKPLMPFKVKVARDIKHAFRFIQDDRKHGSVSKRTSTEDAKHYVIEPSDMDKIMAFIGSIKWESQGVDDRFEIDANHPLFFLYQSIKLIKEELDQLFVERRQFESQLHQARKMESIGRMAGGIAHDFNNILSIVHGNTNLALSQASKRSPLREYLEATKSAASRGEDIVQQLLNFSRHTEQILRPIDAVSVIKDAVKLLRSTIPTSIDINCCFPGASATIRGDPTQINQVLMNLCANSAQAMSEKGGVIEIDVSIEPGGDDGPEDGSILASQAKLKISVSDSGPGIDQDLMDRIFDPYFTTKEVGEGSGMGLSVVHGIVKSHGGTINVESRRGAGTTVTLCFSLIDDIPMLESSRNDSHPHGNETILFVDDDEAIVGMMRTVLEQLGYTLATSTEPSEALQIFRSNPETYDVVVADMTMPKMNGLELSMEIRRIRPDIPIIICTGYSSAIDEDNLEALGISALATKPKVTQDMPAILRRVLNDRTETSVRSANSA